MKEVKILVANGDKSKLAAICECSLPTVSLALKGTVTTTLHQRIREEAIKIGGAEVKPLINN